MFPMNVVDEIVVSFTTYLLPVSPGIEIALRPLRTMDPNHAVGIFPVIQTPVEGSEEFGASEPTLNDYNLRIQLMVKHVDEEMGRRMYAVDTTAIKGILHRDAALRGRLGALEHTFMGVRERFQKFKVGSQRFLNNDLGTQHVFLSVTDVNVQTELMEI